MFAAMCGIKNNHKNNNNNNKLGLVLGGRVSGRGLCGDRKCGHASDKHSEVSRTVSTSQTPRFFATICPVIWFKNAQIIKRQMGMMKNVRFELKL